MSWTSTRSCLKSYWWWKAEYFFCWEKNILISSYFCLIVRVGKNNVMLVCIPNPPVDPKATTSQPTPMLIRLIANKHYLVQEVKTLELFNVYLLLHFSPSFASFFSFGDLLLIITIPKEVSMLYFFFVIVISK